MFGHLWNEDEQLFAQLARITDHLERSAALLEQGLASPSSAAAGIAVEVRELSAERARQRSGDDIDVRAFTGFAMRLDPLEYRELAMALDAAAEAVGDATAQAESVGGHGAPDGLRRLAHSLGDAASTLRSAVPFVGQDREEVLRRGRDIARLVDAGEALYYDGVGAMFDGAPDVVNVLRWKGLYDKVWGALERCADGAVVLGQLTHANA